MAFYVPPAFPQPIPFPDVLDPRTREPFTASAIANLHRKLHTKLLSTLMGFIAEELGIDPFALEDAEISPAIHDALASLTESSLLQELSQAQHEQARARRLQARPEEALNQEVIDRALWVDFCRDMEAQSPDA